MMAVRSNAMCGRGAFGDNLKSVVNEPKTAVRIFFRAKSWRFSLQGVEFKRAYDTPDEAKKAGIEYAQFCGYEAEVSIANAA